MRLTPFVFLFPFLFPFLSANHYNACVCKMSSTFFIKISYHIKKTVAGKYSHTTVHYICFMIFYPFTAPAVSPSTIWLLKQQYTTIVGMMAMMIAANICT